MRAARAGLRKRGGGGVPSPSCSSLLRGDVLGSGRALSLVRLARLPARAGLSTRYNAAMGKRIDIANGNGRGGDAAAGGEDARSCRVGRDGDAAAGDGAAQATRDVALPAVAARNPFARAVPSARAAGSGSDGAVRLALRKVACAIRELDTFEGVLEFELGERLGESASSACVRAAACTTVRTPELSRCAVKFIDDRERAENEWFHLTTYRSPLFPAPFLFGRVVSQGADASASLVAGLDAPARRAKAGGRPPPAPPGSVRRSPPTFRVPPGRPMSS